MLRCRSVLVLLCSVWLLHGLAAVRCAVLRGTANSDDGFAFIGRFCFDNGAEVDGVKPHVGDIALWVHDPALPSTSELRLQWAAYDDEAERWVAVQDNRQDWGCFQLSEQANIHNSFQWDVEAGTADTGSSPIEIQQSSRPRFWFLALFSCTETQVRPIRDVEFSVHFTNIMQSSWDREFGTNERGLNTLYLCLFIAYTLFFIVHFIGVHRLRQQLSFVHPVSPAPLARSSSRAARAARH